MSESARQLKEHLRRVGAAKSRPDRGGSAAEQLEQTIRHSDAHLAAFGPGPDDDTEVEAWFRVHAHLRTLVHG